MPTYEYHCKDCGHDLEAVQGFHDEPLAECPACGGTLRKKFGAVGISFKGSGFYKTDSRTSSSKSTSSSSESASSDSTSSDGKSSSDTSSSSSGSNASKSSSDSGSKSKTPAAT